MLSQYFVEIINLLQINPKVYHKHFNVLKNTFIVLFDLIII